MLFSSALMKIGQWSKILNGIFLIKSPRTSNKWNKFNESHVYIVYTYNIAMEDGFNNGE